MNLVYVSLKEENEITVNGVFAGNIKDNQQSIEQYPWQGMLDENDQRILDYFNPPVMPPNAAEIFATNMVKRNELLSTATLAIDSLQDAVDLEDATAADTAMLKKWKQYRVAVNRVDLTQSQIVWPTPPK